MFALVLHVIIPLLSRELMLFLVQIPQFLTMTSALPAAPYEYPLQSSEEPHETTARCTFKFSLISR